MRKILAIIFAVILMFGLSWLITCGLVKLITLCFGLDFYWSWGTGVWLILILLGGVTNKGKGGKIDL